MKHCMWIWSVLLMVCFTSCEHKELCYHHPHVVKVRVLFDWRNAPEATPEGMAVFFYPMEGNGSVVRYDLKGTQGGEVELQVGKYKVISYNNDTDGVLFGGMESFYTHQTYTREGNILESIYGNAATYAPKAAGSENDRVVITPDMMWGCNVSEVEVTDWDLSYVCCPEKDKEEVAVENTEHVITLYPDEMVCSYTYEIRNVKNLKNVTQMCASLSGMSGGWYPGLEELDKECVTLPIGADKGDKTTIIGSFYTFGHHADNEQEHRLLLYVWLEGGEKYCYGTTGEKFNVTGQIHDAPDFRRVHIIIDGLDLPQAIENGGGFDVNVNDWYEENEEIIM